MNKIKTPLIIMTCAYSLAFMDGLLSLGLTEGAYILIGLANIATLGWLWWVFSKNS